MKIKIFEILNKDRFTENLNQTDRLKHIELLNKGMEKVSQCKP